MKQISQCKRTTEFISLHKSPNTAEEALAIDAVREQAFNNLRRQFGTIQFVDDEHPSHAGNMQRQSSLNHMECAADERTSPPNSARQQRPSPVYVPGHMWEDDTHTPFNSPTRLSTCTKRCMGYGRLVEILEQEVKFQLDV
jgi:hypothetical protein